MQTTQESMQPSSPSVVVAITVPQADRDRLRRVARERGLSMSAYARILILERLKADERDSAAGKDQPAC